MTPKTIIFMGPQGSGKGTQVEFLKGKLVDVDTRPVVDVQTGRLFRALVEDGSFAGNQVGELVNAGHLVPDSFTNAMWITDLKDRLVPGAHLLVDGFPRTLAQAAVVDEIMQFFARPDVCVINLDTPEDVVIERMLARGRADDTPEYIKERLALYHSNTVPVLEHYRAQADVTVHDIDGAGALEVVQAAICEALGL